MKLREKEKEREKTTCLLVDGILKDLCSCWIRW